MSKPILLTRDQIQLRLQTLRDWSFASDSLIAEFRFANFVDAFGFISQVALTAQAVGHYPEWSNRYDKVKVRLYTPELGGISDRDFDLARRINRLIR